MCLSGSLSEKLTEHRIGKVVPGNIALEKRGRHVVTRVLTNKAPETIRAQAEEDATSIPLPAKLHQQGVAALRRQPDIPWDLAVATLARRRFNEEGICEHQDCPG
jgi:hypothetical protein